MNAHRFPGGNETKRLRSVAVAGALALLLCVCLGGVVRADEALAGFVAGEKWDEGQAHYRKALVDTMKAGNADYKKLADLYHGYSACRYYRFVGQRPLPEGGERQLLGWLYKNPGFAMKLMLAINYTEGRRLGVRSGDDDPARIFEMLYNLLAEDGAKVQRYDDLTIAYLLVWDADRGGALSLEDSFGFFTGSGDFKYSLRGMPYQMSKYVIDIARPMSDLRWAQKNFGGSSGVGRIYERQWREKYDTKAFTEGGRVEADQYPDTLENLRRYDGLCLHAARFASAVGKAIGVPSVEILGPSESGVAHAWVGYVRPTGRAASLKWDRESGRLGREDAIVGSVRDPQTGRMVPEHEVDLAVLAMSVSESTRMQAGIWRALAEFYMGEKETLAAAAAIQKSLDSAVYDKSQWEVYARMVRTKALASSDATKTARSLAKKLDDYPGLAMDAFESIVWADQGQDAKTALELCDSMAEDFNRNAYVAARIALLKGRLLERDNAAAKAAKVYADAAEDAMKTGLVLDLFDNAGRLYVEQKELQKAIDMYEDAWDGLSKPSENAFVRYSLWFDLGLRVAALAALNNDEDEQENIISRLVRQAGVTGDDRDTLETTLKGIGYERLNRTRAPAVSR